MCPLNIGFKVIIVKKSRKLVLEVLSSYLRKYFRGSYNLIAIR
jgi:hypothetical protein